MSNEEKFIEIVSRLEKHIQQTNERLEARLTSNDAVIRELATEISQHLEYVHDTVILMLDRLDKLNLIRLDNHPTTKLRDRKVEEIRTELLQHYENIRQLEKDTSEPNFIVEGKIKLEQESIKRLQNELELLQN